MMKLVFLVAAVAATAAGIPYTRTGLLSPVGRIVGGQATTIDKVPYQITLQGWGYHMCGGSIIHSKWILTAAHCHVYAISQYQIRTGSSHSYTGGVVHKVLDFMIHENYDSNRYGIPINDIALVHLKSEMTFDDFQKPIALFNSNEESETGTNAVITGWGVLAESGGVPDVLQIVKVPIISKKNCSAAYAIYGGLPEGQICAAYPEGGKDACQGDSGGPLAIGEKLAGVVSWGNGCARPGYPGAYTEVAAYRDWIKEKCGA